MLSIFTFRFFEGVSVLNKWVILCCRLWCGRGWGGEEFDKTPNGGGTKLLRPIQHHPNAVLYIIFCVWAGVRCIGSL